MAAIKHRGVVMVGLFKIDISQNAKCRPSHYIARCVVYVAMYVCMYIMYIMYLHM